MAASHNPPPRIYGTADFAQNLARDYAKRGGDLTALFAAFAALVSARNEKVAADCLIAVDRLLSGENPKP